MSEIILYQDKSAFLEIVEEISGIAEPVLWIRDDLDGSEISLDREQLKGIMPTLQKWLGGDNGKGGQ